MLSKTEEKFEYDGEIKIFLAIALYYPIVLKTMAVLQIKCFSTLGL